MSFLAWVLTGLFAAGQEVEYYGTRAPYYFETQETVSGINDELQEFYAVIRALFNKG